MSLSTRSSTPISLKDEQGDRRWMDQHEHQVAVARQSPNDVVFVGDSLIQRWYGAESWKKYFPKALSFGIGGDRTEHILWRMRNGILQSTNPKVVLIMAGTNNHGDSPLEVVTGIAAIANAVIEEKPEASVIVMGLFPRGKRPNPLRGKHEEINRLLKEKFGTDPDKQVSVLAIGDQFLEPDGTISESVMPDYLHLSDQAYDAWSCELSPIVNAILAK